MANIYAMLIAMGFYIRFLQIKKLNKQFLQLLRIDKLNICGLILGFLMCLGQTILACFQTQVIGNIHTIGAFLFFFMGFLYFVTQV